MDPRKQSVIPSCEEKMNQETQDFIEKAKVVFPVIVVVAALIFMYATELYRANIARKAGKKDEQISALKAELQGAHAQLQFATSQSSYSQEPDKSSALTSSPSGETIPASAEIDEGRSTENMVPDLPERRDAAFAGLKPSVREFIEGPNRGLFNPANPLPKYFVKWLRERHESGKISLETDSPHFNEYMATGGNVPPLVNPETLFPRSIGLKQEGEVQLQPNTNPQQPAYPPPVQPSYWQPYPAAQPIDHHHHGHSSFWFVVATVGTVLLILAAFVWPVPSLLNHKPLYSDLAPSNGQTGYSTSVNFWGNTNAIDTNSDPSNGNGGSSVPPTPVPTAVPTPAPSAAPTSTPSATQSGMPNQPAIVVTDDKQPTDTDLHPCGDMIALGPWSQSVDSPSNMQDIEVQGLDGSSHVDYWVFANGQNQPAVSYIVPVLSRGIETWHWDGFGSIWRAKGDCDMQTDAGRYVMDRCPISNNNAGLVIDLRDPANPMLVANRDNLSLAKINSIIATQQQFQNLQSQHPGQPVLNFQFTDNTPLMSNSDLGGNPCEGKPPTGEVTCGQAPWVDHPPTGSNALWRPTEPNVWIVLRAWSNHHNPNEADWPPVSGQEYVVLYGPDVSSRPKAYIAGKYWIFQDEACARQDFNGQVSYQGVKFDLTQGDSLPAKILP